MDNEFEKYEGILLDKTELKLKMLKLVGWTLEEVEIEKTKVTDIVEFPIFLENEKAVKRVSE